MYVGISGTFYDSTGLEFFSCFKILTPCQCKQHCTHLVISGIKPYDCHLYLTVSLGTRTKCCLYFNKTFTYMASIVLCVRRLNFYEKQCCTNNNSKIVYYPLQAFYQGRSHPLINNCQVACILLLDV